MRAARPRLAGRHRRADAVARGPRRTRWPPRPRPPTPPTTTGLPRSDGLSRCSTEAKNASRSRCSTDASGRMGATYRSADRRPAARRVRPARRRPQDVPAGVVHRPSGERGRGVGDGREPSHAMTTTLTARGPEDLLAAVPVVLGFRPRRLRSSCSPSTRARTFHARVDLPPPAEAEAALPELVDALLSPCLTPPGGPGRVRQLQRRRRPLGAGGVGAAGGLRPGRHRRDRRAPRPRRALGGGSRPSGEPRDRADALRRRGATRSRRRRSSRGG